MHTEFSELRAKLDNLPAKHVRREIAKLSHDELHKASEDLMMSTYSFAITVEAARRYFAGEK